MSNELVGRLYSQVIDGVLEESRGDFEDNGLDDSTLLQLKELWQERLSALNVAHLPWEQMKMAPAMDNYFGNGGLNMKTDDTVLNGAPLAAHSQVAPGIHLPVGSELGIKAEPDTQDLFRGPAAGSTGSSGLVLPGGGQINQVDGADDSDDPDRINSDLDDSEDALNSGAEDEDEEGGMIMLCLYDKVQRVKNKWKYVLKDGVANINGKDYVFSRGNGESEW